MAVAGNLDVSIGQYHRSRRTDPVLLLLDALDEEQERGAK